MHSNFYRGTVCTALLPQRCLHSTVFTVRFYGKKLCTFVLTGKLKQGIIIAEVDAVEEKFNKAEYDKKYIKDHYYRMNIVIPKDMRSLIDEAAKSAGVTKNSWLKEAIEEKLARQGK